MATQSRLNTSGMDMHVSFRHGLAIRRDKDWDPSAETEEVLKVMPTNTPSRNESNFSDVRMQNACGFAVITNRRPNHTAWQMQPSIFGKIRKAYTLAGNVCLRSGKVVFKGASTQQALRRVLNVLLEEDVEPCLQLVVLSIGIGRCLFVMLNCLLERKLSYVPWAQVMHRIEEVCSVVVFYVVNWRAMERALGMKQWEEIPKTTTVSVTRRGTLTLRLASPSRVGIGRMDGQRGILRRHSSHGSLRPGDGVKTVHNRREPVECLPVQLGAKGVTELASGIEKCLANRMNIIFVCTPVLHDL